VNTYRRLVSQCRIMLLQNPPGDELLKPDHVLSRGVRLAVRHHVPTHVEGGLVNTYQGRTLHWLRRLLGQPARDASAWGAEKRVGQPWSGDFEPPLGAVLFYDTGLWHDVGLYVGDGWVLRYSNGRPRVRPLHPEYHAGLWDVPVAWAPSLADPAPPTAPTAPASTEEGS
jgi:hypothetical protein